MNENQYPRLIQSLPQADLPIDKVVGYLFQGERGQICFFDFEGETEVPPHSHGDQWGVVLDGKLSLTIGDKTRTFRKGDAYFIPAGVVHAATIDGPCKVLDFFADANRYQPKAQ